MTAETTDAATRARALALHRDAIVVDALDVSVMDRAHLEHMREGGVTAANHTITLGDGHDFREAVDRIVWLDDHLRANADLARRVTSVAEIRRPRPTARRAHLRLPELDALRGR